MAQSRKRSPQSEFWNIREKRRKTGKRGMTHSKLQGDEGVPKVVGETRLGRLPIQEEAFKLGSTRP